jgi:transposase-like protein
LAGRDGWKRCLKGYCQVECGWLEPEDCVAMNTAKPLYHGYRYPAEIVSHAVWLYFRFTLSHRDVEERRAARGILVTYETIRRWCLKFG